MTSQRKINVTYINDTGKPIFIKIFVSAKGITTIYVKVDESNVLLDAAYTTSEERCGTLIIPPNSSYSVSNTISAWYELR